MRNCVIDWRIMTAAEWDGVYSRIARPNLLQAYPYAQAMRKIHHQGVRHGMILLAGEPAGIVQMQEVGLLGGLIHGISLDRGPLWFDGYGKAGDMAAFAGELNRQFPKRTCRRRRFLPEWAENNAVMQDTGWTVRKKTAPYYTHFVDLTPSLDDIRKNLRQKWRNVLNRAEKQGLSVEQDWTGATLPVLLKCHMRDRLEKRYAGASPKILTALAEFTIPRRECLILNAIEDNEIIAGILLFLHGRGATYQLGWTTPYGRDKGAHHLLLWEALKVLKPRNINVLDTGGFNDETPGIKHFKDGLGGHAIALIGGYF